MVWVRPVCVVSSSSVLDTCVPRPLQVTLSRAHPCVCLASLFRPYQAGKVGFAYPVDVPEASPLRSEQAVSVVIHVVPPNMNPSKPDCLDGDYERGSALMTACYAAALECFRSRAGFVAAAATAAAAAAATATTTGGKTKGGKRQGGGWADALTDYIRHPERHADTIVHSDAETMTIRDKFPKARHHLLVMPQRIIDGFRSLSGDDVATLEAVVGRAEAAAAAIAAEYEERSETPPEIRVGFHAVPSMNQV